MKNIENHGQFEVKSMLIFSLYFLLNFPIHFEQRNIRMEICETAALSHKAKILHDCAKPLTIEADTILSDRNKV